MVYSHSVARNSKPMLWMCLAIGMVLAATGPRAWASAGTSSASFLQIGTSARSEAMGGAYNATVNDEDATNWNPAGLAQLQRSSLGFTHLEWFQDVRYEYLSYADKYDYVGAVGIGLGYLYMGNIPRTLETATGDYDEVNSGGTFGASNLLLDFALAGNLGFQENKAGLGVKIIQESIADSQSFGFGLDFGDQILISKTRWFRSLAEENGAVNLIPGIIGFSLKNLGTPLKFFSQGDPLPLTAGLGIAYQFMDEDLTTALDMNYQTVAELMTFHVGAEYWIRTAARSETEEPFALALRAGYRTGYDATSAPGLSLGAGFRLGAVGLDYVYMPFGDLGVTHRISLKFSWGEILKDKVPPKRKHIAKRQLTQSELALQDRANQMMKSKKTMEGKVVVQKAADAKQHALTAVEAKKPEDMAVATQAMEAGAEMTVPQQPVQGMVKPTMGKVGTKKIDNALIEKIVRGSENKENNRTRTKYIRRSQDDAIRAAKLETEAKNKAMDDVEAAAQSEVATGGKEMEKLVTKTTIYFAKNSSKLDSRYMFALDKIATSFDKYPQRTILVHGYTSNDEEDANNLSLKRAKAVRDYFVQIKSIPSNKLSIKGFGDKDPEADNNNPKQRVQNRRVRIQLIKSGN